MIGFLRRGHGFAHRRRGVSELIGTLIMVTITLIAGAAVFGFVNGLAGNSESQYGSAVATNINSINERFEIINVQFSSGCYNTGGTCSTAYITVFNTGKIGLNVSSVTVTGLTVASGQADAVATATGTTDFAGGSPILGCSTGQFTYTYATTTVVGASTVTTVETNTAPPDAYILQGIVPPAVFTINLPTGSGCPVFGAGTSYGFQALGSYGNTASFQITAGG